MDPELLQTLSADPEAARELVRKTLAEHAASDPRLGMLMQMLAKREQDEPAPNSSEPRREHARQRLREMRAELEILRERNEVLAAALGACAQCWGDDETCPDCRGEGGPGWRRPAKDLYDDLVAPVAARQARVSTDHTNNKRTK